LGKQCAFSLPEAPQSDYTSHIEHKRRPRFCYKVLKRKTTLVELIQQILQESDQVTILNRPFIHPNSPMCSLFIL